MQNHTPTNADLLVRSLSAVWHPRSQMKHYENFPLAPIALKMSAHYWRNTGKPDKTQFISLKNSKVGCIPCTNNAGA